MFIRAKKHGDRTYYYLVENERKDGKVVQRVVRYVVTTKSGQNKSVVPILETANG